MMKKLSFCVLIAMLVACESAADKADRFFLKGNVALNEGKNEEAIRMYDEAISINPRLKEAYNNKGLALYREGKLNEAIDTYTDVLFNVDAYYIDAKKNRLIARIDAGEYNGVAQDLKFLGDAYPDSAYVDMLRGIALTKAKNYFMARVSFERAYRKDTTDVEPIVNIANAFYYEGLYDQAVQFLDSAEAINPNISSIYNTRSLLAVKWEKFDEAIAFSSKALEMEPDNPYYVNNRGFAYLKKGALDLAEADINVAIKRDIYNGWAYRNKGIYYNMKRDFESAVRNFELAVRYDSAIELLHANYGDALFELGRQAEACQQWQVSVDQFENQAREKLAQYCQ